MATLDLMSGGRLEFGIGRGSEAFDYEAFGLDHAMAQARTEKALDVILGAWTNERFSHTRTFFQVPGLRLWPLPQQRPHPPVWVSCSSRRSSFEWTARRGYNLLTLGFPRLVPAFAETVKIYRDEGQTVGREPAEYQVGTLYHTFVREKSEEARQLAGVDVMSLIDQARVIAGNPAEVADMLSYLQGEVGFTHLNHMFQFGGLSFEVAHESMAQYAQEGMPRLRARSSPAVGSQAQTTRDSAGSRGWR